MNEKWEMQFWVFSGGFLTYEIYQIEVFQWSNKLNTKPEIARSVLLN